MPCKHRFYHVLDPQTDNLEYLFIGTFNPEWDAENDNNAQYFYGRFTNDFWSLLPQTFGDPSLTGKSVTEWIAYCNTRKIGITDLVREITNADKGVPDHYRLITEGYADNNLDKKYGNAYVFTIHFNTDVIKTIIERNILSLKGVFFTRKTGTGIPRIWAEWQKVCEHCNHHHVRYSELITPSGNGRRHKDRMAQWKKTILPGILK